MDLLRRWERGGPGFSVERFPPIRCQLGQCGTSFVPPVSVLLEGQSGSPGSWSFMTICPGCGRLEGYVALWNPEPPVTELVVVSRLTEFLLHQAGRRGPLRADDPALERFLLRLDRPGPGPKSTVQAGPRSDETLAIEP
jgi:hypothetical protein